MRNRFEALGDIDDPEKNTTLFSQHREMQQRKSWGGQRNIVGHG